jgi:hypothetical protein
LIDGKPLAFERFQTHWGFERTSNLISDRAVLQRGTQTTPPRSGLVQPCAAANGGGPSQLQSARLVAAVAELGSFGAFNADLANNFLENVT